MKPIHHLLTAALATTLIAGCNSSSSSKSRANSQDNTFAVINTLAPDYSDANLAIADLGQEVLTANEGNYYTGFSDFAVASHGEYFYRLGRFGMDSITKYSISNPNIPIYTYSTLDDDNDFNSNPYDLISIDSENAYLLRYGSKNLWQVAPNASKESQFLTKRIDLSDYSFGDDIPEMSAAVYVKGKLYVTLQNLDTALYPQNEASIIVLDPITNTVEKEIKLETDNPSNIIYNEEANALYVVSPGRSIAWPASHEDSGIEKIDLADLSTSVVFKGSDEYSVGELAISSPEQAYISLYYDWEDSKVFSLNLATGELGKELDKDIGQAGILGLKIIDEELWVSVANNISPYIGIYDIDSHEQTQKLDFEFNPEKVVLVEGKKAYNQALVNVKVTGTDKDSNIGFVDLNNSELNIQEGYYNSGESNIMLTSYKNAFYRIGSTNLDSITKYDIDKPNAPVYTLSTLANADDASNGPYSIAFLNDNKAYVPLYAGDKVLTFNPSAKNDAEVEASKKYIDISTHVDSDGKGEAVDAVIIGDKLYVLMQNLAREPKFNFDNEEAKVLVIDTATDKVIQSIKLQTQNPNHFAYHPTAGLYAVSVGKYMLSYYTDKSNSKSGLEKVSLDGNCKSNCTELVVDGDDLEGGISNAAIAHSNKAYISIYKGYGTESIRTVDLSNGKVSEHAFNGLEGEAISTADRFIVGGLTVHKGDLWVSVNETKNPRVEVFDINTDEKKASLPIPSGYGPEDITFIHAD